MKTAALLSLTAILTISDQLFARESWRDTSKIVIPELRYKLNASGSHYIKGTFLTQVWARFSDLNPGSTIDGTPAASYGDIGIRRWRIQAFGQITDRLFFYTQFGQNNFNFLTKRHTGAFLHDAVTEYKAAPWLHLGGGLTGWSGMSRYSSPGVGSILGIDAPLYQQSTNGINEQFVRKLSLYAKGDIGRLNYRMAISGPMSVVNSTVPVTGITEASSFSLAAPKMQHSGYFMWQFLDKETTVVPYMTGTYLGKKKVLNFGAGWVRQNDAMTRRTESGDTVRTPMLLLGADLFADLPVGKNGAAVTAYAAYNHFDFGKNYVRMNGPMNPANGVQADASLNGAGISYPMIGTGTVLFAQAGYKLRDNLLPDNGTLQAYASMQYSQFRALSDPAVMYEGGVNWLIHGNHAGKISLGIQSRPVFGTNAAGQNVQTMRKNMYVLQYQISL